MKILQAQSAPNARRLRIFLAEKGIDMDYEEVDIMKGDNLSDAYRANINIMGKIPVLEFDDGTHLAESVAISRYFEEVQPEPPLMGSSPREKAEIEMWNRRAELDLLVPVSVAFRNGFAGFADRDEQVPEIIPVATKLVLKMLDQLNSALADRDYLAGDNFSIADITCLCSVDFAKVIKQRINPETHPNLAAWHERVSARPSAKA